MRASLPQYEMKAPGSLGEAIGIMAEEPGRWKAFAGGTDLMVLLEAGKLAHRKFVSLWRVRELRGIVETSEEVRLGALTTYTEALESAVLRREFPLLCRAAAETGGVATQNRGTLGGNIANASPAADSLPALIVYDAELELVSAQGARRVPYHGFHTGYKTMDLRADEIIRCIHLPRQKKDWRSYYRKVGTRRAQAISKVCLAAVAKVEEGRIQDLRIALGSVAPTVVRAARTEAFLRGKAPTADVIRAAGEELAREIAPIDDVRSTARYRRRVAQNLLEEFLSGLAAGMPATR
jgi:CO/xanthine dehydrogenase FAD-binding subunit